MSTRFYTAFIVVLLLLLCCGGVKEGYIREEAPAASQGARVAYNVEKNQTYDTIQEAIDNANYGDTIRLFAGNFSENIFLYNGVTLKGSGAGKTVLTPYWYDWVVYIWGTDCTLEDLTVSNPYGGSFNIYISGHNSLIQDCVIDGGSYGVYLPQYTVGNKLLRNTIKNVQYGFYIGYADTMEISGNDFHCSEMGIMMGYSLGTEITANTFHDCYRFNTFYLLPAIQRRFCVRHATDSCKTTSGCCHCSCSDSFLFFKAGLAQVAVEVNKSRAND